MEIRIQAEYCEVREAMELLWLAVNTTKAERKEGMQKIRNLYRQHSAYMDAAEKIIGLVDKIKVTEKLRYYFEELQKDYLACLASAMIMTFDKKGEGELRTVKARVMDSFSQYEMEAFPVFEEFGLGLLLQSERAPFWKSVQNMSMEEGYKARMLFAFADFQNSLDEVFALLEAAVMLLAPYKEWAREQAKEFGAYWRAYFENHTGEELLESINLKADASNQPVMYFGMCLVNGVTLRVIMEEESGVPETAGPGESRLVLYFNAGFAVREEFLEAWARVGKRGVQDTLRLLADPSKLEILLYIRETPHYGKEIADHFKLSTPTVSYHMNELLQQSLIKINQQGKRVYYELNREKAAEFLEQLQTLMLGEDGGISG